MTPDIEIITKPGRSHAALFANSIDGEAWIVRNIGRPLCRSMACFDPLFIDEFRAAAVGAGLNVDVCVVKQP